MVAWVVFGTMGAVAQTVTVDAETLQKLQETIRQQQGLLEKQSEELKAQARMLDDLQRQVSSLSSEVAAAQTRTAEKRGPEPPQGKAEAPLVTSGHERVKLSVSGQINRAMNMVSDGKKTSTYFVDNDASNSRVRFVGTAKVTDDLTLGSRVEVAFAPDISTQVSQKNQSPGDFVNERWVEVSLASETFGKISLGKGDTASNNTAEVDLSKTDVVQYSSIADIAGGMLFRESDGDQRLTNIKVSDAFQNRDGLTRQSRIRYDTPTFYGFSLAGSLVTNERADAALFWGGQTAQFKAAAAAAIAYPNLDNTRCQADGSLSVLHQPTGLNLTLSGGVLDRKDRDDPTNLWAKVGWITHIFDFGPTAFGLDYGRSLNLPTGSDEGYTVGAALVQSLDRFGTELFLQYRLYSLDRESGSSVESLNVGTIGARTKF
jgi:hypothetical protein